jgi:hypothetical protein
MGKALIGGKFEILRRFNQILRSTLPMPQSESVFALFICVALAGIEGGDSEFRWKKSSTSFQQHHFGQTEAIRFWMSSQQDVQAADTEGDSDSKLDPADTNEAQVKRRKKF